MAAIRGCMICKKMIEPERAENNPRTRLCIEHAVEIQRFGGEFRTVSKQERVSKKESLKIMLGGVTTEMRRNEGALRKLKAEYDEKHGKVG